MRNFLLSTFLLFIVAISCTKQNYLKNNTNSTLELKANVKNDVVTKGIIKSSTLPLASEIGVQVIKSTEDAAYFPSGFTNIKFTADLAGVLSTLENCYLSSDKGRLYAYYPYITIGDNMQQFNDVPISIPQVALVNTDTDYMFSSPLDQEMTMVNNLNNSINLVMNHATTQISLLVYKESYSGTGELTQFTIVDADASNHIITDKSSENDLMMNIVNGIISGGQKGIITRTIIEPTVLQPSSSDPQYPSSNLNVLKNQVDNFGVSTLIVPTDNILPGEIKFGLKIDGIQYYVTNTSAISWERGKQYIYKIKLSGSALTMSSVTITDWQPVLGDDMNIQ